MGIFWADRASWFFRDPWIAALLKQPRNQRRPLILSTFPRSLDRGPIEALHLRLRLATPAELFRDPWIAALLKQGMGQALIFAAALFRDPWIAALLKQESDTIVAISACAFSAILGSRPY